MSIVINGGAGITFPDTVQQTNAVTNTGGNPLYYAARAWVNYKGTSTRGIRASVNVASVTRNSTGNYTFAFTTPMPDANYAIVATAGGGVSSVYMTVAIDALPTASSFVLQVITQSGGAPVTTDPEYLHVVVFR